ncbi:MAG: hypothetical protein F7C08_01610 [Desulfurococcales archaeon]|nr:hypothetical protein [Desulfurococcales archaeon]MCE4605215.1 hypothetical protein [Desulfurococcales archaeon]
MPAIKFTKKIDEASTRLADPLVQTKLILYSSYQASIRGDCNLASVIEKAMEHVGDAIGMLKIDTPKFRSTLFIYNGIVASAILERGSETLYGRDALAYLEDYKDKCIVEIFSLNTGAMDEDTIRFFREVIIDPTQDVVEEEAKRQEEQPQAVPVVNLALGIKLGDKVGSGPFSVIYEAEDLSGARLVVKTPRYPDDVMAVVAETDFRLVQSASITMKLRYVNEFLLYRGLRARNYNETLAKSMVRYRENIAPVTLVSGNFRG